MKKLLTLLLLSFLPGLSFAAGEHAGDHGEGKALSTGTPGHSVDVSRTIKVEMDDNMRFSPTQITVKAGETIRFSVKNRGQLPHEFVIGNTSELKAHAQMMREMPDMQHHDAKMVNLNGGQTGALIWKFNQAGSVDFACLIAGHWEAGMKGEIAIK